MAKSKPKQVEAEVETEVEVETTILSKAEEFYIENNPQKDAVQLAIELDKPIDTVQSHIHHTQGQSRINKLIIRDKGCTIMTEGASMAADEARTGYVSETAIREAAGRGDYKEAARLQALLKTNTNQNNAEALQRQNNHIYYMHKPNKPTEVRK